MCLDAVQHRGVRNASLRGGLKQPGEQTGVQWAVRDQADAEAMSVTASPALATASCAAATNERPTGNRRNSDVCDRNTRRGDGSLGMTHSFPALTHRENTNHRPTAPLARPTPTRALRRAHSAALPALLRATRDNYRTKIGLRHRQPARSTAR